MFLVRWKRLTEVGPWLFEVLCSRGVLPLSGRIRPWEGSGIGACFDRGTSRNRDRQAEPRCQLGTFVLADLRELCSGKDT